MTSRLVVWNNFADLLTSVHYYDVRATVYLLRVSVRPHKGLRERRVRLVVDAHQAVVGVLASRPARAGLSLFSPPAFLLLLRALSAAIA